MTHKGLRFEMQYNAAKKGFLNGIDIEIVKEMLPELSEEDVLQAKDAALIELSKMESIRLEKPAMPNDIQVKLSVDTMIPFKKDVILTIPFHASEADIRSLFPQYLGIAYGDGCSYEILSKIPKPQEEPEELNKPLVIQGKEHYIRR